MLSIGTFARLGGVSVRTLRYYDEVGLLEPAAVDTKTGYRSYSARQLPRLHRIIVLKDLGLSLQEMHPLLDHLSAEQLRGMLVLKRAELQQQLEDNLARLAAVEHRLRHIDKENDVLTDAIVKHIPDLHIATVRVERRERDFNDLGPVVGPALTALIERLDAAGVRQEGPVFLHHETDDDDTMVVNVAVPVGDQAVPADDLIDDVVLPAIDVVSTVHHGA